MSIRWLGPVLSTTLVFGCVSNELESMEHARARYEECVEAHGESDRDCRALRAGYLEAQKRYETNSRRAWSCDPATEECPTPR
jgi:hypothetical protein